MNYNLARHTVWFVPPSNAWISLEAPKKKLAFTRIYFSFGKTVQKKKSIAMQEEAAVAETEAFSSFGEAVEMMPSALKSSGDKERFVLWWRRTAPLFGEATVGVRDELSKLVDSLTRERIQTSDPGEREQLKNLFYPKRVRPNQPAMRGAIEALQVPRNLEYIRNSLMACAEKEVPKPIKAIRKIMRNLERKDVIDDIDAYQSLLRALRATMLFLKESMVSDSDINLEDRAELSQLWKVASDAVRKYDVDLYIACFDKNLYWADPSRWNERRIRESGISLDQIAEQIKEFGLKGRQQQTAGRTCDIGILTVISEELHAIKKALGSNLQTEKHQDGTIYLHGRIRSAVTDSYYTVTVAALGRAGNPVSAAATATFIERHHPKVILLVGIAAGIRGKVKIGTVVLSEKIVAYEPAALVRKGKESWEEARPDISDVTNSILQDITHYEIDAERIKARFRNANGVFPRGKAKVRDDFKKNVVASIDVRKSVGVSGEKLLRDPTKLLILRKNLHGKIEFGEMEAAGFVTACAMQQIDWLVIRGISDFGDKFKDDSFHNLASLTAASVAVDFLENGLHIQQLPQHI